MLGHPGFPTSARIHSIIYVRTVGKLQLEICENIQGDNDWVLAFGTALLLADLSLAIVTSS